MSTPATNPTTETNVPSDGAGTVALDIAVALIPLIASVLWLPLRGGGNDPGPLVMVQVLTLASLITLALWGRLRSPRASRWTAAILLSIAVAAGLATLLSKDLDASFPLFIRWIWLLSLGLLVPTAVQNARGRTILLGSLVASAALQLVNAFFVWWGGGSAATLQAGRFFSPNHYAGFLVLLLGLLLFPALSSKRTAVVWWAGAGSVFCYLGIMFSGSRAGLGAALVATLAALVFCRSALSLLRGVVIGLVVVGGLLVALRTPLIFPAPDAGLEDNGSSGQAQLDLPSETTPTDLGTRINWAKGGWRIFLSNPVSGTGLGTYGALLQVHQEPDWAWSLYAHNHYLEALAEGGALLGLGVIAFHTVPLIRRRKTILSKHGDGSVKAIAVGLIGASAHMTLDHDWSFAGFAATFVVMTMLLGVDTPKDTPPPKPLALRLSVAALGLMAALGAMGLHYGLAIARDVARAEAHDVEALALANRLAPTSTIVATIRADGLSQAPHEAIRVLESAARLDEVDPNLLWRLAELYVRIGSEESARSALHEAIRIAPNSPRSYGLAAGFELEESRPEAAAEILDRGLLRLLQHSQASSRLAASIASLYMTRASAEELISGAASALPFVAKALEAAPNVPRFWAEAALFSCRSGDQAAAFLRLDEARRLASDPAAVSGVEDQIESGCPPS